MPDPTDEQKLAEAVKTLVALTLKRGYSVSNVLCAIPLPGPAVAPLPEGTHLAVRCVVVIGREHAEALDAAMQRLVAEGKLSPEVRQPGFPRVVPEGGLQ